MISSICGLVGYKTWFVIIDHSCWFHSETRPTVALVLNSDKGGIRKTLASKRERIKEHRSITWIQTPPHLNKYKSNVGRHPFQRKLQKCFHSKHNCPLDEVNKSPRM